MVRYSTPTPCSRPDQSISGAPLVPEAPGGSILPGLAGMDSLAGGHHMTRFAPRQLAAIMVLAFSVLAPAVAGEAPPAAPPKPYPIPAAAPDYIRKAVQSPERTPAMTA